MFCLYCDIILVLSIVIEIQNLALKYCCKKF
jgi:hypothetical protein